MPLLHWGILYENTVRFEFFPSWRGVTILETGKCIVQVKGGIPAILDAMERFRDDPSVINEGCYALAMLAHIVPMDGIPRLSNQKDQPQL